MQGSTSLQEVWENPEHGWVWLITQGWVEGSVNGALTWISLPSSVVRSVGKWPPWHPNHPTHAARQLLTSRRQFVRTASPSPSPRLTLLLPTTARHRYAVVLAELYHREDTQLKFCFVNFEGVIHSFDRSLIFVRCAVHFFVWSLIVKIRLLSSRRQRVSVACSIT